MKKIKYNIYINQLVLAETSLDLIDGAILDYLHFLCGSSHPAIVSKRFQDEKGNLWTWIDLKTISEQMPLLKIKDSTSFSVRLKKIEQEGFIELNCKREKGVRKLFVRKTSRFDSLMVQDGRGIDPNGTDHYAYADPNGTNQVGPNGVDHVDNSNIYNNTTIDTKVPPKESIDGQEPEHSPAPIVFSTKLLEHYKTCSGETRTLMTDGRKQKLKKRLGVYSQDQVIQAITNCFNDPFYRGENDRGWKASLDYILRSDEIIDRLLNLKSGTTKVPQKRVAYEQ